MGVMLPALGFYLQIAVIILVGDVENILETILDTSFGKIL